MSGTHTQHVQISTLTRWTASPMCKMCLVFRAKASTILDRMFTTETGMLIGTTQQKFDLRLLLISEIRGEVIIQAVAGFLMTSSS